MTTLIAAFAALAAGACLLSIVDAGPRTWRAQVSLPSPQPDLERENALLRRQNAQLQSDLLAVQADLDRLRQQVERLYGRRPAQAPNPLGGGQER